MANLSLNFLNSIAEENDLHHRRPTAMLQSTGWINMRSAAAVGWPLAALLWLSGFSAVICLVPFFASFGNLVHRFSHTPKRQLPAWILFLQRTGLFISHEHHDAHHRSMKALIPKHLARKKYCPMTDWVNPVLDAVRFWGLCEGLLALVGIRTTEAAHA